MPIKKRTGKNTKWKRLISGGQNRESAEKQERENGQKVRTALPVHLPVIGPIRPTIGPAKDVRLVVMKSKIVIPTEGRSEGHGRDHSEMKAHSPDLSEPLNIHPEETELLREGNRDASRSYNRSSSRRNRSRDCSPDDHRGRSPQRRRR
jgi:hypothetical protein